MVREPPAGLEVGAHEPVRALQHPLCLRIGGLEDHPADTELPAERRELISRPAAADDRALAIPHQLLRQHPDPLQAPAQAPEDVGRLLAEDQRSRRSARDQHNSAVTT